MGNTDAHLKNWAVIYPDGVVPRLSPAYEVVCITSLFDNVSAQDFQINRAIDKKLCAFTWSDFDELLTKAKVVRKGRLLKIARETLLDAQARWPALLTSASPNIHDEIISRLGGRVALADGITS